MDDWMAPAATPASERARRVVRARAADDASVAELAELLAGAESPALVVGAGADDPETWAALVDAGRAARLPGLAGAVRGRAGFPQDHPLFAGHLPADRSRLRETLAPHDFVFAVGAPVFRQYPYVAGTVRRPGTRVAIVSEDAAEAHRSTAELAVLAAPPGPCAPRSPGSSPRGRPPVRRRSAVPAPPSRPQRASRSGRSCLRRARRAPAARRRRGRGVPLQPARAARRIPARAPLGSLSAAMGGLGFALPAAIGVRMALPDRPVVAVVGDGSSLYAIQSLWSAAHYDVGALFVILSNGGYAIMDRLAEQHGGGAPWPCFESTSRAWRGRSGARRAPSPSTESCCEVLDEVVPDSRIARSRS